MDRRGDGLGVDRRERKEKGSAWDSSWSGWSWLSPGTTPDTGNPPLPREQRESRAAKRGAWRIGWIAPYFKNPLSDLKLQPTQVQLGGWAFPSSMLSVRL